MTKENTKCLSLYKYMYLAYDRLKVFTYFDIKSDLTDLFLFFAKML